MATINHDDVPSADWNDGVSDDDNDTKIQLEESADEDKIRFDTAGTQRALIDSTGLNIDAVNELTGSAGVTIETVKLDSGDLILDVGGFTTTLTGSATGNCTVTFPDGTGTLLYADSTKTLTNTTFDANGTGNSITNIENADIAAAAGIATSKLADATQIDYLVLGGTITTGGAWTQTGAHTIGITTTGNTTLTFPTSGTIATTTDISGSSQASQAWVNFAATDGTIEDDFNVSSVDDNGTGNFYVNFTSNMSSIDFAAMGSVGDHESGVSYGNKILTVWNFAVGGFAVRTWATDPYASDPTDMGTACVAVFAN